MAGHGRLGHGDGTTQPPGTSQATHIQLQAGMGIAPHSRLLSLRLFATGPSHKLPGKAWPWHGLALHVPAQLSFSQGLAWQFHAAGMQTFPIQVRCSAPKKVSRLTICSLLILVTRHGQKHSILNVNLLKRETSSDTWEKQPFGHEQMGGQGDSAGGILYYKQIIKYVFEGLLLDFCMHACNLRKRKDWSLLLPQRENIGTEENAGRYWWDTAFIST